MADIFLIRMHAATELQEGAKKSIIEGLALVSTKPNTIITNGANECFLS